MRCCSGPACWALKRDAQVLPGQYLIPASASMADILTHHHRDQAAGILRQRHPRRDLVAGRAARQRSGAEPDRRSGGGARPKARCWPCATISSPATRGKSMRRGDAKEDDRRGRRHLGAARSVDRRRDQDRPSRLVTLASLVEKETGARDRAPAGGVGVHQPAAQEACGCRPTRSVIYGITMGEGKLDRGADHQRPQGQDRLQHLPDRRPAARPDRQSRHRGARGGGAPDADQLPLLRRQGRRTPPTAICSRRPMPSTARTSRSIARQPRRMTPTRPRNN